MNGCCGQDGWLRLAARRALACLSAALILIAMARPAMSEPAPPCTAPGGEPPSATSAPAAPASASAVPQAPQQVYNVTTLLDYGPKDRPIPGSLRYVLARAKGPAIIRFTVGGAIHLKDKLSVETPYLAIDGSTAPAPGITFYRHQFEVAGTHHVVLRHLRFRCGDGFANDAERRAVHGDYDGRRGPASGGLRSLLVISVGRRAAHDVLIENCSIQNSTDDNGNVWEDCRRITFRRCLFSGGYVDFTKGLLIGVEKGQPLIDDPNYVTIDQCLFAFMKGRAPDIMGGVVHVVNNVICGSNQGGRVGLARGNFVNNYLLNLQDHPWGEKADRLITGNAEGSPAAFYLSGNTLDGVPNDRHLFGITNRAETDYPDRFFRSTPWPGLPDKLLTAEEALRVVIENAGCTLPARDEHDREVIARVRARVGWKE